MLTPRFELSQDNDYLILSIHAPFAKVSDTEFYIENLEIRFYSKPYYLRLHLSNPVVEDGREEVKYEADRYCFTAKIPKQNSGEVFEGLDMLTKLLTPPGETSAESPAIEVIPIGEESNNFMSESSVSYRNKDSDSGEPGIEEDFKWYYEQSIEPESDLALTSLKYGFANQRSGVFTKLVSEFSEVLDVRDPDTVSAKRRRDCRLEDELKRFSEDHYLADTFDSDVIPKIIKFQPWWTVSDSCELNEDDRDRLLKLPKKKYLIDAETLPAVYLGLVDIVFAYAYNHRFTEGEENVESGWTIAKLSATLSWLETFSSLQDVMLSCFRRALIFPLYRNWNLCERVLEDVRCLFVGGKLHLLKCLLEVSKFMIVSDPRYILNDLYITDYCVWIQSADDKMILSLAKALMEVRVMKNQLELDLEELEKAAEMVLLEEGDVGSITTGLKILHVSSVTTLDSDDDDDSGGDDTDTELSDDSDTDNDENSDSNGDESEDSSPEIRLDKENSSKTASSDRFEIIENS